MLLILSKGHLHKSLTKWLTIFVKCFWGWYHRVNWIQVKIHLRENAYSGLAQDIQTQNSRATHQLARRESISWTTMNHIKQKRLSVRVGRHIQGQPDRGLLKLDFEGPGWKKKNECPFKSLSFKNSSCPANYWTFPLSNYTLIKSK